MFIKSLTVSVIILLIYGCNKPAEQKQSATFAVCQDFQSSCTLNLGENTFDIVFDKTKLTPEQPFTLYLRSQNGFSQNNFFGYLEGVNMYMGKIPLFFELTQSKNQLKATSMFGSCSEKQMIWRLWVVETKVGSEQVLNKNYIDISVMQ